MTLAQNAYNRPTINELGMSSLSQYEVRKVLKKGSVFLTRDVIAVASPPLYTGIFYNGRQSRQSIELRESRQPRIVERVKRSSYE